jgi:hypothetical protein
MGLLKKNLIFSIVMLVCLLAFAAGAYLAFAESGKIAQAEQNISSAKSQLTSVLNRDPAPTEANIAASAENVRELRAKLEAIRENLEQGSRLTTSSDGIQVMASIQQFISDYQNKAEQNTREENEAAPISLPDDFAFGFEQYISEATIPNDPAVIPVLDKQRQILSYLLNKLFSANPHSIVSVKREVVEKGAPADETGARERENREQGFKVNPAISAEVPGAIETLGFSLTFTGYTDSLREFLNSLSNFDLPIVVRSIEVNREATRAVNEGPSQNTNNLDAIFGTFGGNSESAATQEAQEVQKPVIAENVSSFTVILEFIEVTLPEETEGENL